VSGGTCVILGSAESSADVVVCGGGPAGSAAAATLARLGLDVLLLTGAARRNPWVETVPIELGALLPALGLPATSLLQVGQRCCWDDERRTALHLDRTMFDGLLRRAVAAAGARSWAGQAAERVMRDGARIAGLTTVSGLTVRARAVVDASGMRGWLRRRLALADRRLSPPMVAWRGQVAGLPAGLGDCRARFSPFAEGWLHLATSRGRTTWTRLQGDRRVGEPPAELAHLPMIVPPRACDVSWRLARPVAGPGWLLAGDAGGRLDPGWGQGLLFAVISGLAAARTAAACLAAPTQEAMHLSAYDGWFADRIFDGAATLRRRYAGSGIRLPSEDEAGPVRIPA